MSRPHRHNLPDLWLLFGDVASRSGKVVATSYVAGLISVLDQFRDAAGTSLEYRQEFTYDGSNMLTTWVRKFYSGDGVTVIETITVAITYNGDGTFKDSVAS